MSAFKRGTLAATLAAAMVVVPAFAGEAGTDVVPKNNGDAAATQVEPTAGIRSMRYAFGRQASDYSEEHPVVVIAISKGQKETLLTGEQMAAKFEELFRKVHDVPTKVFVEPGGDYTSVGFAVKGLFYGPYGLKESLVGMSLAADSYNEVLRPRPARGTQTAFAGKPEPQQ